MQLVLQAVQGWEKCDEVMAMADAIGMCAAEDSRWMWQEWRATALGAHPAVGTKVQCKDGAGVVVEVKEYAGIELMVIKMDIAGTMSCPLERLAELKL